MSKIIPIILVLLCATGTFVECHSSSSDSSSLVFEQAQIIAKATGDVFKAVAEFLASVGAKIKDAFQTVTAKVGLALSLRAQLIVMASGVSVEQLPHYSHKKFYSMAASTTKMCGKLNVMEKCMDIVNDVSSETADFVLSSLGPLTDLPKVWKYFSNSIQTRMDNDPELFAVYTKIEQNLPFIKYTDMKNARENEAVLKKTGTTMLEFILHKMLVQHSYVNILTTFKKEYYVTARSILELAKKTDKLETLQDIYDKVVSEVISSWDEAFVDVTLILDTAKVMYTKIEEKIAHDSSLKYEYDDTKKMVEKSTKWTNGLLNVDLLPF